MKWKLSQSSKGKGYISEVMRKTIEFVFGCCDYISIDADDKDTIKAQGRKVLVGFKSKV